jgi:hypothetical protein
VIAPGLWEVIDANTCQNRQNSAAVDMAGSFDGFGGFVTAGSTGDQQSLGDSMSDSGAARETPTVVTA